MIYKKTLQELLDQRKKLFPSEGNKSFSDKRPRSSTKSCRKSNLNRNSNGLSVSKEVMVKVVPIKSEGHLKQGINYILGKSEGAPFDESGMEIDLESLKEFSDNFTDFQSEKSVNDRLSYKGKNMAYHVILSFNGKNLTNYKDRSAFFYSAEKLAAEKFHDRPFVVARHGDTANPHLHVVVGSLSDQTEKRLSINRQDIENYRACLASSLREKGVEADATPFFLRSSKNRSLSFKAYKFLYYREGRQTKLESEIFEKWVSEHQSKVSKRKVKTVRFDREGLLDLDGIPVEVKKASVSKDMAKSLYLRHSRKNFKGALDENPYYFEVSKNEAKKTFFEMKKAGFSFDSKRKTYSLNLLKNLGEGFVTSSKESEFLEKKHSLLKEFDLLSFYSSVELRKVRFSDKNLSLDTLKDCLNLKPSDKYVIMEEKNGFKTLFISTKKGVSYDKKSTKKCSNKSIDSKRIQPHLSV